MVKTILTDIEGVASTSADLLPYGKYRIEESKAPEGYLTDGAEPIEFEITEDGKIVDLIEVILSVFSAGDCRFCSIFYYCDTDRKHR